jgi:hypothetical protein
LQNTHSLADITRITGAKRRTLQLWAEAGVLLADETTERAGTGTHRQFDEKEAALATILTQLRPLRIPVGPLLEISSCIRKMLNHLSNERPYLMLGHGKEGWHVELVSSKQPFALPTATNFIVYLPTKGSLDAQA